MMLGDRKWVSLPDTGRIIGGSGGGDRNIYGFLAGSGVLPVVGLPLGVPR